MRILNKLQMEPIFVLSNLMTQRQRRHPVKTTQHLQHGESRPGPPVTLTFVCWQTGEVLKCF